MFQPLDIPQSYSERRLNRDAHVFPSLPKMTRIAMSSSSPRILEIGEDSRMCHAFADTTEFFSTFIEYSESNKPPATTLVSAKSLLALSRRLSTPDIDLIVVHASQQGLLDGIMRTIFRRSTLQGHLPIFRTVAQQLLRLTGNAPMAVLDMQDSRSILACNRHLLRSATLYFKRELPPDRWQLLTRSGKAPTFRFRRNSSHQEALSRIRPLSLGIPADVLRCETATSISNSKDIDVFFAGRLKWSSTVRERGADELAQLSKEGLRIEIGEDRMSPPDYLARCARAWLVWAPEGYGWDCFRAYEAALAGSVPLVSRQTIERHQPFMENEHCIYYDLEPGQLAHAVRQSLKDRDRLLKMAQKARDHVLRHHTPQALAHHIVETTLSTARRSGRNSI